MNRIVTIDNSLINRMLADPATFGWLPCLKNPVAPLGSGCGQPCGGGTGRPDYSGIKTCLAGLESLSVERLKTLLGASQLEVYRPTVNKRGGPASVRHVKG